MGMQDLQNYKDLLGSPYLMGFKHIGNPGQDLQNDKDLLIIKFCLHNSMNGVPIILKLWGPGVPMLLMGSPKC